MFRVNGRTLMIEREPICTIEEYINGEVLEELLTWAFFMSQHLRDVRPAEAMRHNSYKRINRRVKQVTHGIH